MSLCACTCVFVGVGVYACMCVCVGGGACGGGGCSWVCVASMEHNSDRLRWTTVIPANFSVSSPRTWSPSHLEVP